LPLKIRMPPAYIVERGKSASQFFDKYVAAEGKMVHELKLMPKYSAACNMPFCCEMGGDHPSTNVTGTKFH
jgi:hypothetical protein